MTQLKYKLVKISDDRFEGKHPNNINEGYIVIGILASPLIIGECLHMYHSVSKIFHTSTVTGILKNTESEKIFETLNSTYKLTLIENE